MVKKSADVKTVCPIIANGKIKLAVIDPRSTCGFKGDREASVAILLQMNARLVELQEVLYTEHKHKVLVVLQATDAGGKDGVIRKVFADINPLGIHVASFKTPTTAEPDQPSRRVMSTSSYLAVTPPNGACVRSTILKRCCRR